MLVLGRVAIQRTAGAVNRAERLALASTALRQQAAEEVANGVAPPDRITGRERRFGRQFAEPAASGRLPSIPTAFWAAGEFRSGLFLSVGSSAKQGAVAIWPTAVPLQ
jgi:hypothetical protein